MDKVCILLPSHWDVMKGGAEYQADCLAEYIAKDYGIDVSYLARNTSDSEAEHGYTIIKIPASIRDQKFGLFWDSFALYKKLVAINPDVVWQHVRCAYTGVASYYCKKWRKRMVWHIASDKDVEPIDIVFAPKKLPSSIDNLIFKYGIKNATRIIAQTKSQSEMLFKNYGRYADAIIPNFHPLPNESLEKSGKFTVLWVANFKKLKQPEIFIRLAKDFSNYDYIHFKMIGRAENSKWCDELLIEISQTKNLEYLGEMSVDAVNEQIAGAHILVNTSLFEGFPNTFIQAWMREVPTLSLNVDPDGIIKENNIGLCAKNYDNLKHYILTMAANSEELKMTGARARKFALEGYSLKNADKLIKILDGGIVE